MIQSHASCRIRRPGIEVVAVRRKRVHGGGDRTPPEWGDSANRHHRTRGGTRTHSTEGFEPSRSAVAYSRLMPVSRGGGQAAPPGSVTPSPAWDWGSGSRGLREVTCRRRRYRRGLTL